MKVTIIGAGNMARGIGTRLLAGGHSVTLHARNMEKAQALAGELSQEAKGGAKVEVKPLGDSLPDEVVILAVPYSAEASLVEKYRDQLPGSILVEISNPIDGQTFELIPPPGSSASEEIAKIVPQDTKVVKAFNTTFASTLVQGQVKGQPIDVFIAGDDEAAKATVAKLVEDGGLRPLDVGPIRRARNLEAFQLLHISLQKQLDSGWMSTVKLLS
ncbi:MAG: NADPH-dependent F420 reductase [Chloroflexi bacterium]|nr:NADPH-dependent F420 reductase [Chloroflexota bacterium]